MSFYNNAVFFIYINSYYALENERQNPEQWSIFGKQPENLTKISKQWEKKKKTQTHNCESSLCQKDCMKKISKAKRVQECLIPKE